MSDTVTRDSKSTWKNWAILKKTRARLFRVFVGDELLPSYILIYEIRIPEIIFTNQGVQRFRCSMVFSVSKGVIQDKDWYLGDSSHDVA